MGFADLKKKKILLNSDQLIPVTADFCLENIQNESEVRFWIKLVIRRLT